MFFMFILYIAITHIICQNTAISISNISRQMLLIERSIIRYFTRVWQSVSSQITSPSSLPTMFYKKFLDESSDFSILIKDLDTALILDSENVIMTIIPFSSLIQGFERYYFVSITFVFPSFFSQYI